MEDQRWLVTRKAFGVVTYWWRDDEDEARNLAADIAAQAAEDGEPARVEVQLAGRAAIRPSMVAGVGP